IVVVIVAMDPIIVTNNANNCIVVGDIMIDGDGIGTVMSIVFPLDISM
ncbi:19532_t:CDS:2, partial [Cetraspora pellucida]